MMKKVLYGVALALLACGPVVTLQSCKDDVSDLKTQTSFDLKQLEQALNDKSADLQRQITENKGKITENAGKIGELEDQLGELDGKLGQLGGTVGSQGQLLEQQGQLLGQHTEAISELQANYSQLVQNLEDKAKTEWVEEELRKLEAKIPSLTITDQEIEGLQEADRNMLASISSMSQEISGLTGTVSGLSQTLSSLEQKMNDYVTKNDFNQLVNRVTVNENAINLINQALTDIDTALGNLNNQVSANSTEIQRMKLQMMNLKNDIQDIKDNLETLQGDVATLKEKVEKIENELKVITGRIDNLITSLLVQGVTSPVFGDFSLPIGVRSNVLFEWYGYNKNPEFQFPSGNAMTNYYDYGDEQPLLTASELNNLIGGPDRITIPGEDIYGDVTVGNLYMTINPAGHNFDPAAFGLETSAGKQFPAVLDVKKSNDELKFGYSRAQVEGNGFYKATVTVPKEKVGSAKIEIEEGLKEAAKAALKTPSKRTALELLKSVYAQLNGKFPAYAVSYNWTAADANGVLQPYSVRSGYEIAATTARPLSYSFLYGQSSSKKLRPIGHIDNILNELKGKFQIKFTPISFDNIKITLPDIDLKNCDVVPNTTVVSTTLDPIKIVVDGEEHYSDPIPVTINIDNVVNDIVEDFNEAINDMTSEIKGWTADANAKVSAQLKEQLDPIASQINGMVEDLQGQIDSMIDDIIDKADPYFDRVNKVIDIYNKVADKINELLSDPNHYLQVAMFYRNSNGLGVLSNSLSSPTPFKSGNGWVGLYASSYTGELLAPAYKKYVAITNIYDAKTRKSLNPSGSELRSLNAKGKYLNEVKDGSTIRFGISASSLEKGKIYEIAYQGVDYCGKTSTQKFYITVE